jgi:hypothetical protein
MKETGRSAQEIAQDDADRAFHQESDAGSQQAGGRDGRRPSNGAGSRETS